VSVSAGFLRNAAGIVGRFANALWLSPRSTEVPDQLSSFLIEKKALFKNAEVPEPIAGPLHAFVLDRDLSKRSVRKLIKSLLGLEGWLRGRTLAEREERVGEEGPPDLRERILEANRFIRPEFIGHFFQATGLDSISNDLHPIAPIHLIGAKRLSKILGRSGYWKYESKLPTGSYMIRGETYVRMKALIEGSPPDPAIADQFVRAGLGTIGLEIEAETGVWKYPVVVPSGENIVAQGIAAWLGPKNVPIFVGQEGDLPDDARWKKQPLVLVHTDPKLDVTREEEVIARYGLDRYV
jgi:hypothetical protein